MMRWMLGLIIVGLCFTGPATAATADPYAGYGSDQPGLLPASGVNTPNQPEFDWPAESADPDASGEQGADVAQPAHNAALAGYPTPPSTFAVVAGPRKVTGRALPGQPLARPTPPRHTYWGIHPPAPDFYDLPLRRRHYGYGHYHRHGPRIRLYLRYEIGWSDHGRYRFRLGAPVEPRFDRPGLRYRHHLGDPFHDRGSTLRLHLRF